MYLRFHGSSDVDEVLDAMEYACYAHDVEHVILDNLQVPSRCKATVKGLQILAV